MNASVRAVVDRPIDGVWAYGSAVEHMEEWAEGVENVRRADDAELGVDARFSSDYAYRGRTFEVEYEVTAVEPPNRLDLTWAEGPFPFASSVRLRSVEGGTDVSYTVDAGSDSKTTSVAFAVLGPLLRRLMGRRLAKGLDRLAERVEEPGADSRGAERTDPGRRRQG